MRVLDAGKGRVGLSLAGVSVVIRVTSCLCCGATILRDFAVVDSVEEGEELLFSRSICISSPSASDSDSDESGLRLRRCKGRSCAGVDFGRGGGVMMRDKSLSTVSKCRGAAVAPECRRGRVRACTDIILLCLGFGTKWKDDQRSDCRLDIIAKIAVVVI